MYRFALLSLTLIACPVDDTTKSSAESAETGTPTTPTDPAAAIQGDWVSTGDDIAPLLTLFLITDITATFNADGSYAVTSTDSLGSTVDYTGTYAVGTDTDPRTIVLTQATPAVLTSEGIWAVDDQDVMQYEVIQTKPALPGGFTAPTPEAGFGSTAGPGLTAGDNLQVFRRPAM